MGLAWLKEVSAVTVGIHYPWMPQSRRKAHSTAASSSVSSLVAARQHPGLEGSCDSGHSGTGSSPTTVWLLTTA